MNRRQFLQTSAGGMGGLLASHGCSRTRPANLILIMADDLGYECIACNGAAEYKTPNLDAMAASGVRFTRAHSTPLCTPTRVQLMTGKYNFRNYTEFGSLPQGEFSFGHLLREAGYRTCAIGKWQLAGAIEGTAYRGEGTLPHDAGFQEHCLWQVKDRGSRYWAPTVQVNGELHAEMKGRYGPDVFVDYAVDFIERNRSRPFFLYYPMALPHDPFVPTPKSIYSGGPEQAPSDPVWFGDMVAYVDHLAGRILTAVDEKGIGSDTLVLFTSDNGTHPSVTTQTRDGPFRGGKGGTTMAGTHVPLIARWLGASPKGTVCDDLIDFTDFFPTIASLAGEIMPAGHPRDGRSFLPQLRGHTGSPRDWIYCHYEPKWGKFLPARWAMDDRWKLYADGRFIDLENDPLEQQPITALNAEMRKAEAKFKEPLSRFRPGAA